MIFSMNKKTNASCSTGFNTQGENCSTPQAKGVLSKAIKEIKSELNVK